MRAGYRFPNDGWSGDPPLLGAPAIRSAARLFDDHFQTNVLEFDLIVNRIQKIERFLVGHLRATQLDSRWFTDEFRMRVGHFPIEQEGNVGIEFFLELKQPQVRAVPLWLREVPAGALCLRIARCAERARNTPAGSCNEWLV